MSGSLELTDLDPLLRECHRRLSTGQPVARVTLGATSRDEQDAVADLLGLETRPGAGASFPLADVEAAVRALTGRDLRGVLVDRYGPIGDRAGQRALAADAKVELWRWLRTHDVVQRGGLGEWADAVAAKGVRTSVSATRVTLERALAVLDALPAAGEPLPVFAGRVVNDTHALDGPDGLAALVLGAIAAGQGIARPVRASDRRALWRSVGVADDALSSTVLVAGFDAVGTTAADDLCGSARTRGRAACLTLADVRDGLPTLRRKCRVWVMENPAIMALALDEFGVSTPAMLCVSGWPSTAAMALLSGLGAAGHELVYHGDLDGEGVRIAAHVVDEIGATPWRMSAVDYRRHVALVGAPVGRVTPAPWDEDLASAMIDSGVAVLEETVWHVLRDDLAREVLSAGGGAPS